ncbi:hypothetical protein, partial [Vibrio parahaemolyticus]|uniref:hypothetical protein n=1 Tax=Vibrio parahaemolyticus TaxID=670 RepID=UPI00116E2E1D
FIASDWLDIKPEGKTNDILKEKVRHIMAELEYSKRINEEVSEFLKIENDPIKIIYSQATTFSEVKRIKRELSRKHHPDRGGNTEIMARINLFADERLATL